MIHEIRTHTLVPGRAAECLRLAGGVGLPARRSAIKVKGMLMSPDQLQEAIRLVAGVDEFQVVVTRQDPADPRSMDALVVRVASRRPDAERLTDQLVEAAASATGVRPPVALTGANDIYDPRRHAKAQRFVDRRSASAGAGE